MDHHHHQANNTKEYLKFALVLAAISGLSVVVMSVTTRAFLDAFMGVFFLVFAGFKLINLKEFAYGFQSYDIIAAKSLAYSYAYPFVQLVFGFLYLAGLGTQLVDIVVIIVSLISAAGVIRTLGSGAQVHCVCLGNVIKLPLSRITFVEDFGMALMAAAMLFMR